MASFQFVNHASFIIRHNGATLLADPWFFGSAFNDGWDLLVETPAEFRGFDSVTHIWFSHEHPDHFSVPTIRSVPEARRPEITVIFQQTRDKRLVRFCERLGFKVIELRNGRSFQLAADFTITLWKWGLNDSFCRIDADGVRVLNLNDCLIGSHKQAQAVAAAAGNVDVLLTQFSYAGWCGNEADRERRRNEAAEKLARVQHQIHSLTPKVTIPFASFVYFSHADNFYLNDGVNTPAEVHRMLGQELAGSRVHFMYPGDTVDLADLTAHAGRYDDGAAMDRYAEAYARITPARQSEKVSLDQLQTTATAFFERIRKVFGPLPVLLEKAGIAKPLAFRLTDHGDTVVRLSYRNGFTAEPHATPDIQISSATLAFLLKFDYGCDTIGVSGQFRTLNPAAEAGLDRFFALPIFLSNGIANPLVVASFLVQRVCRGRAPSLYLKIN